MQMLLGLVLLAVPSAHAYASVTGSRAFLGTNMQPAVVARTLQKVEDEWRAQAAVFAQCNATNFDGTSIVDCEDAPASFGKSCGIVVGAIVQGSNGDKRVAREYMVDVCGQTNLMAWHKVQCLQLSHAVGDAMSADGYDNRYNFDSKKLCTGFWSTFLKEETARIQQEKVEREAEEKRAAEEEKVARELAEKKAQEEATEAARKAEEERKAKEAREKTEEAARKKAEAEAKAKAAAEKAAQKKAEAEAEAKAAKQKMEEAKKAEEDQKQLKEKLEKEEQKKEKAKVAEKKVEKKEEKKAEKKAEKKVETKTVKTEAKVEAKPVVAEKAAPVVKKAAEKQTKSEEKKPAAVEAKKAK